MGTTAALANPGELDYSGYTNPLLVVTGENDGPFCAGNCQVTSLGEGKTQLDTVPLIFSNVPEDDIETYVVPATGHGINYRQSPILLLLLLPLFYLPTADFDPPPDASFVR